MPARQSEPIGGNARAVLVAMIAATGASEAGQDLCALLLDRAVEVLQDAPAQVIAAIGGSADPVDRMAGVALVSELCVSCRLCPRGQDLADDRPARFPGPIGAHRWRRR